MNIFEAYTHLNSIPVDDANTNGPFPRAQFNVVDTNPVWVYCRQANHCQQGMVFASMYPCDIVRCYPCLCTLVFPSQPRKQLCCIPGGRDWWCSIVCYPFSHRQRRRHRHCNRHRFRWFSCRYHIWLIPWVCSTHCWRFHDSPGYCRRTWQALLRPFQHHRTSRRCDPIPIPAEEPHRHSGACIILIALRVIH